MQNTNGPEPAATSEWHFFKDMTPKPDDCISVYWEKHDGEYPECFFAHDYTFVDDKLYDVGFDAVDLDAFAPNVIWCHWPKIRPPEPKTFFETLINKQP